MSKYREELKSLNDLRERIARFHRVAFHCHTPLSYDWGNRPCDSTLNDEGKYNADDGEELFIKEVLPRCDPPFEVLAPTDHMKCGYAARLHQLADRLDVVVIPGMEVTIETTEPLGKVKVHIIALMDIGGTQETFGKILRGLPEEHERTGEEVLRGIDLHEWVRDIHELGGLAIAAHVENDSGMRYAFRQTAKGVLALVSESADEQETAQKEIDRALRDLLFGIGLDAIEIRAAKDDEHYIWIDPGGKARRIATVLGLDAHCIEEYGQAERITLIKMTSLADRGLVCLKEAFEFADTRIRFPSDVPETPCPRLLGMVIEGTDGKTFFPDLTIAFSENLNAIIGPRGAGKSALVEALRYVFGYNRTLEDELEPEHAKRVKDLQEATLDGATIRVYYETKAKETFVLESQYVPKKDYGTIVLHLDGTDSGITDVERSGAFPLRLYGWSEIELLGRYTWKQRVTMDRMIPDIHGDNQRKEELREETKQKLAQIKAKAAELTRILSQNAGQIENFESYQIELAKYNTAEVKELFEELDLAFAQDTILEKVKNAAKALRDTISKCIPVLLTGDTEKDLASSEKLREWWNGDDLAELDIKGTEQAVEQNLTKARERLDTLLKRLEALRLEVAGRKARLEKELRNKVSADPEKRNLTALRQNAKDNLQTTSRLRDDYLSKWRDLRGLVAEHCRLARELRKIQTRVSAVRAAALKRIEDRLNTFLTDDLQISLYLREDGDQREFRKCLPDLFKPIDQRNDKKWAEVLCRNHTPDSLGKLLLLGGRRRVQQELTATGSDGKSYRLKVDDLTALAGKAKWYATNDGAKIPVLTNKGDVLTAILVMRATPWEDEVSIALNGKPVDSCSPGQRSSAMLPLIMLAEDSPLIIDQPEDNLDNRIVSSILTEILAERKEHRQIIVCTHNPNIVVLGDAEQVIPLDPVSDRKGKVGPCPCGSIDNEDIVRAIVDNMEGGADAFKARETRYKLDE